MPFMFISNLGADGEYRIPKGSMLFYDHDASTAPTGFSFVTIAKNKYIACGSTYGESWGNSHHRHGVTVSSIGSAGEHSHAASGSSTPCNNTRDLYTVGTTTIVLADGTHNHNLDSTSRSTSSGSHTHSFSSNYTDYAGNYPRYNGVSIIKAELDNAILPAGAILMYNSSTLPPGGKFVFCDGNNGTPDFTELLIANTPDYRIGGSHSHEHNLGELSSSGAHTHNYSANTTSANIGTYGYRSIAGGGFDGSHAHRAEFSLDSNGAHTHGAVGTGTGTYKTIVPSLNIFFIKFLG